MPGHYSTVSLRRRPRRARVTLKQAERQARPDVHAKITESKLSQIIGYGRVDASGT